MLALPSNFIGLFLVLLLLLFCKAQHRNVVRSYASLAAQLTHYSVCFNSPMSRLQLCVSLFGTVFASMFNNSCEGLNIKFTYCSKSSLEFLLCNLVRWIQKSCQSNISRSCEAEDIQGIDCCKVRKLSEFTANFLSKGKIKAIPRLSHMYSLFLFFIILHCTRRSTCQAFKETNPKTILWLSCHNFIDPFCSDCQLMLQGKEMMVMFVSELKPIEMSF